MRKILYVFIAIKYLPLLLHYCSGNDKMVKSEIDMYLSRWKSPFQGLLGLVWLFCNFPEFLSIYVHRIKGLKGHFLKSIYRGQPTLFINTPSTSIGYCLMIWHGFATIINAKSIGNNCSIWQQVTIGNKLDNGESKPVIGNNVRICAGAIVIGDIKVGDNSVIAAGAVVVKDVPANCVVAGVPAKIISKI